MTVISKSIFKALVSWLALWAVAPFILELPYDEIYLHLFGSFLNFFLFEAYS